MFLHCRLTLTFLRKILSKIFLLEKSDKNYHHFQKVISRICELQKFTQADLGPRQPEPKIKNLTKVIKI